MYICKTISGGDMYSIQLQNLRREIEGRMKSCVETGKTISSAVTNAYKHTTCTYTHTHAHLHVVYSIYNDQGSKYDCLIEIMYHIR